MLTLHFWSQNKKKSLKSFRYRKICPGSEEVKYPLPVYALNKVFINMKIMRSLLCTQKINCLYAIQAVKDYGVDAWK